MYCIHYLVNIQYTQTYKEKVRLTSGVAYHSSESFALRDGNIIYNHHLFFNQDIKPDDKKEKKKKKKA